MTAPVRLSLAGNKIPLPQSACLAVRTSVATHCSKDQLYLSGENCRHIARVGKMKIFLFIFSNLQRLRLRDIKHSRWAGLSSWPLDGGQSSAYFWAALPNRAARTGEWPCPH
ncbi:hypothetical protein [Mesorhizobium australafricanum]|uniref:Uncharacterized protein n=1 Tax=Mesorhizobium australafricanum TaxID=3072311 RepID=A0ABU4X2X9_9HYPH|nr:hypothetical protein [Mesorhizobium sp. VK3E]MDX8442667.1 hypothetical protein [Mesorhizobium sp. VK3E]